MSNIEKQFAKEASGNQKKQDKHETVETALLLFLWVKAFQNYLNRWVQHIISSGQTMNPSTEDIVKVIEQSQCKRAIILPNNKIF